MPFTIFMYTSVAGNEFVITCTPGANGDKPDPQQAVSNSAHVVKSVALQLLVRDILHLDVLPSSKKLR